MRHDYLLPECEGMQDLQAAQLEGTQQVLLLPGLGAHGLAAPELVTLAAGVPQTHYGN